MTDASTEVALRDLSRIVGGLESTVKTLVSTWQSQEATASQGRRDLHQKFDNLRDEVHVVATKVTSALDDIAEIKPSVEAFDIAKHRVEGARTLGKMIWLAIGGLSGLFGYMLANWISIGPKH